MSGKKELVNIYTPADLSIPEPAILEFYIAEEVKGNIEKFVEGVKKGLKTFRGEKGFIDKEGKTSFSVKDHNGLELNISTSAGRKSFNQTKAAEIIKERLGQETLDKKYASFKIEPKSKKPVPPEVAKIMEEYFTLTKEYSIDEKDLWTLGLLQEDQEACYDRGEDVIKVTRKSKIPGKMLLKMYEESKLDFLKNFLPEN
jgi:hypothetical protein